VCTVAGQVKYLDLSIKLMALGTRSAKLYYDIYIDAIAATILRELREGMDVNVSAVFDGTRYAARSVDFQAASKP